MSLFKDDKQRDKGILDTFCPFCKSSLKSLEVESRTHRGYISSYTVAYCCGTIVSYSMSLMHKIFRSDYCVEHEEKTEK